MNTFELIFPSFIRKCAELHELLRVVAFALFVTGTILLAGQRLTGRALVQHLIRLTVLVSLLVLLPAWGNRAQDLLQSSILDGLGADPGAIHQRYRELVIAKRDLGTGRAWWDLLGQLSAFSVEGLVTAALWLVGLFGSLLLFWAYIFQKFILFVGYALSPLMIGLMAIPALRGIGHRYLLNLTGVLLWPLGWAVASLMTQGLLDFMTDPSIKYLDPTASGYRLQTAFGLGALTFWVVFSTIAAPVIIQKVFTQGALAAGEFMAGAAGGFLQAGATTAAAAAVAAPIGLPLVTAGAAGMAGLLSTVSLAAGQGSAGAILIAGSGLPPRTARGRPGDDVTGDRAVRELIARRKNPYS